jgi:hypothetical protein
MVLSRKVELLQSRRKPISLANPSFPYELICADVALLHIAVAMMLSDHLFRASLPQDSTRLLASQILYSCHVQSPPLLPFLSPHSCQSDLRVTNPRATIHTPLTAIAATIAKISTARSEAAPNRPDAVVESLKEESARNRAVARPQKARAVVRVALPQWHEALGGGGDRCVVHGECVGGW